MKKIFLVILLVSLFSTPSFASNKFPVTSEYAYQLAEVLFKANFCGNYYDSRGNEINYKNYEFKGVKFNEKQEKWEVIYALTDEAHIELFKESPYFNTFFAMFDTERIDPIIFYIDPIDGEVTIVKMGILLTIWGDKTLSSETSSYILKNVEDAISVANIIFTFYFNDIPIDLYKQLTEYEEKEEVWIISYISNNLLPEKESDIFKIYISSRTAKILYAGY